MNAEFKQNVTDFFRFTTTRPVAIFMIVVAVCVFGLVSYDRLALNLMPDISYPSLTIRTEYPGTAPEEIETTISRPLEQQLGVVSNLVSISSISKAGFSDIILEFTWDTDMNAAIQDVREKLDQVFLPPEAKKPLILKYDPTLDPIQRLGLYGDQSLFALRYLAEEEIKRELETLEGVAAVKVRGGLEEEIRVELDERQITLLGLDIQEVNRRLASENINLAGGNLKEGQTEYLVRTLNEFRDLEEIRGLVIGRREGVDLRVKDVGTVTRTNKEREVITRVNGKESVEIEIYKEADANIVTVAQRVKEKIFGTPEQQAFVANLKQQAASQQNGKPKSEEKKPAAHGPAAAAQAMLAKAMTDFMAYHLPASTEITLLSDQSTFIQSAIDEVKGTAILGGILAVVVLYIFLRRVWNTIIIAAAIPISVIATFGPMFIFDVTLNIMSLGGLALGIGMLVDNAIVVLESIHRKREEGQDLFSAAVQGTGEVGGAVLASTLTTVAVFFPIVFVKGVAGQIFGDMALTVVFSLLASLAVALFVVPMLASRYIKEEYLQDMRGRFAGSHVLRLAIFDELKSWPARTTAGESVPLLQFAAGALGRTVRQVFTSLLFLAATLLLMLLKATAVLALLLPTLLVGWLPPLRRLVSKLASWTLAPQLVAALHTVTWDTIFVFKAYDLLVAGGRGFAQKFSAGFWWKKALLALFGFPIYLLYSLVRFMVQHLSATLFKTILMLLFALAFVVMIGLVVAGIPVALFFAVMLLIANPVLEWSYRTYPKAVRWALHHRSSVLAWAGGLFAVCSLVLLPRLGVTLIPEVHKGEFNIEARFPVGTPVEATDEKLLPLGDMTLQHADVQRIAMVAGSERTSQSQTEEGEHTAKLTVTLKGTGDFERREEALIAGIRRQFSNVPEVETKISRPAMFSFKTPIEVEIKGYNLTKLKELGREAEARLARLPNLKDVRSNIQTGNPEVQIIYDRNRLAFYNLNINEVAAVVRNKVQGVVATEFREADRRIDIRVKVDEEDKAGLAELKRLVVNPNKPVPIPLAAIADIQVKEGPSEIRRIEQQRAALITANISGVDLKQAAEQIHATLSSMDFPDDFTFTVTGQNAEMETSINSLMLALALAVFLIYVVMAAQFESLLHPFVIMFTIPLALIGVVLVLWVLQIPLSVVVFIGMILLVGVVVNNAIILIDYINHLRRGGMEKIEAIVKAGSVRLRPILITTGTTVLGLLPMALGLGDGAEIRTPMAITVIAGLTSSTLLTLIVIPVVYAILDRSK